MKIKHQLLLTHGALVFLCIVIVLINVITYKGIEDDTTITNQAGRLRAISYDMAQLSNRINNNEDNNKIIELNESLKLRIKEFEGTLEMLSDIKKESTIKINHHETMIKLEEITKEWNEVFKPAYTKISEKELTDAACSQINEGIELYVNNINEMVTSYSLYSRGKVMRALGINGGLVILIIIVTVYSYKSTNNRIRKPMEILMEELKELSLIDDGVSKKLRNIKTNEISKMTEYFNEMLYDQLTNTFNRRSGIAKLSKMLQYNNGRNLKMSLCFIDINGLKVVNDNLGHEFGDELIVSAVQCIKERIRDEDFIIRMGGDEFLIVLKGIDEDATEKVWNRILNCYEAINVKENRKYVISVSHGIIETESKEEPDLDLLIKEADDKMYAEKRYIKEVQKIEIIKT